ncbi:MAG: hypothetical protein GWM90_01875, partial [Gemmatimonadetes bacterium]|nr:hypothetical protein [Gemmatimonadota bacterium]NIQ52351.1 hypothetical protein [Gemmatimonadota bacterium]NIU72462.1 hypothetical protein [Gammaproteobacteria bacterium]NIX42919.1 hypothetical protein [Gemmatimonadota bacterium]NIY07094.1 hypothetical protein [Gemmatimonadota bacterium]
MRKLHATAFALVLGVLAGACASAGPGPRPGGPGAEPLPSIAEKTAGLETMDGFLPLYW